MLLGAGSEGNHLAVPKAQVRILVEQDLTLARTRVMSKFDGMKKDCRYSMAIHQADRNAHRAPATVSS
jgi:hypothetical protein